MHAFKDWQKETENNMLTHLDNFWHFNISTINLCEFRTGDAIPVTDVRNYKNKSRSQTFTWFIYVNYTNKALK